MNLDGWTLEVDWLGKTWTWSGIRASLTERMELYSDEPTFRSVSVSVIFERLDVAAQYAAGHRLEGAPARLVLDGVTYLRGKCDTPRFGGLHHPVSFTVREVPWDDHGIFPPKHTFYRQIPDLEALDEYFGGMSEFFGGPPPTVEEITQNPKLGPEFAEALAIDLGFVSTRAIGYLYPFVFGAAGTTGDGTTDHHHRIPAYPVVIFDTTLNAEKVLLAGHAVDASTVEIWSRENGSISDRVTFNVQYQEDHGGRSIAVCDLAGDVTILSHGGSYSTERELFATWLTDATPGGAGQVIEAVLAQSTARVDWPRLRGARDWLDRYQLAGVIDEEVTPYEWVADNVLPLLSASVVTGRDGIYLAPYHPDGDPLVTLEDGIDVVLDEEIRISGAPVVNELRINFARSDWTRKHARSVTADSSTNAYSALSRQVYGARGEVITTDIVYDAATADLIAREKVRAQAFASRLLTGTMRRQDWHHLRAGDKVAITSDALSLDGQECTITALTLDGGPLIDVEFAVLEDPIRTGYN